MPGEQQSLIDMFGSPAWTPVSNGQGADESLDAAASLAASGNHNSYRLRVLRCLHYHPGTDRETAARLGLPESTVRPRRVGLAKRGLIERDEQVASFGRAKAWRWKVTSKGTATLHAETVSMAAETYHDVPDPVLPQADISRLVTVLWALQDSPRADFELERDLGLPGNTLRPRRVKLLERGHIERDGTRLSPRSQTQVSVWRVTVKGTEWMREKGVLR